MERKSLFSYDDFWKNRLILRTGHFLNFKFENLYNFLVIKHKNRVNDDTTIAKMAESDENRMLSLLEFRRHFNQIRFAADSRDPKEQADRLNFLVPLFLSSFSNASAGEIREKFGEHSADFTRLCSLVLVKEVKKRANNRDPDVAGKEVAKILLPNGSCWNLFQCVRILAFSGGGTVEKLVSNGVASCLSRNGKKLKILKKYFLRI